VLNNGGRWRIEERVLRGNWVLRIVVSADDLEVGADLLLHAAAYCPNVVPAEPGNGTVGIEAGL
jgi:hypothetical protein